MNKKSLQKGELYESRFGFAERNSNFCFLLAILVIVCSFFLVRMHFVKHYGGIIVSGSSMERTLSNGDKLFLRYTDTQKADYGDIIVVYVGDYEECKGVDGGYLIKRLIAKEHDRVKCENGQIYICYDGTSEWVRLEEDYAYYGKGDLYKSYYDFATYTVGKGEVFFLGDNRSSAGSSVDSRYAEGKSHLKDSLYKETDIVGFVPEWSLNNKWLGNIFLSDEINNKK